jgi:hypothetical protein
MPAVAHADDRPTPSPTAAITRDLRLEGFSKVNAVVVEELLPRALPTVLTEDERAEFERRLWALALFDDVAVQHEGEVLVVRVREKWTLVPNIDASTSKTVRDSYLLGSLVEVNLFGRAQELGGYVAYVERAVSAELWWAEHQQSARRISFEGGLFWVGSGFAYEDPASGWERRRLGARFGTRLPFGYGSRFRLALLTSAYRENLEGTLPKDPIRPLQDGFALNLGLRVVWDRYTWNDVVPAGLRLTVEAGPGAMLRGGSGAPRHAGFAQVLVAQPFTQTTVLTASAVAELANPGDPNHSVLLGNVPAFRFSIGQLGGIRGLIDNTYRNFAHAFADIELRQAIGLWPRWFVQGVLFVDLGVFAPLDARGAVTPTQSALSTGVGVRVLPTAIAGLVPRLDAGSVHAPREAWFWTMGLSQYF